MTIIFLIIGLTFQLTSNSLYYQKQEIQLNNPLNIYFSQPPQTTLNLYLIIPNYFQSTRLYIQSVDYYKDFKSQQNYENVKNSDLLLQTFPEINIQAQIINMENLTTQEVSIDQNNIVFPDDKTNTAIFSEDFKQNVNNSYQVINWWRTSTYADVEKFIGQITINESSQVEIRLQGQIRALLATQQENKAYLVLCENNNRGSKRSNQSIALTCYIYCAVNVIGIIILGGFFIKFGKRSKKFDVNQLNREIDVKQQDK